jgi:sirohydrochlorin ferrochelatase
MKTLLIVAHGSRRAASNEEVRTLTDAVAAHADNSYHKVACAFLELAEPSIPDGLRALIEAGADDVTVVPYFLSAGRHVVEDIPAEVEKVTREYPEIPIRISPYLGDSSAMAALLLGQAALGS